MKNYQIISFLALALLLLIFGLTACQNKPQQEPGRSELTTDLLSKQPQTSVTAFFKAPDCPVLVPLVFGINPAATQFRWRWKNCWPARQTPLWRRLFPLASR